MSYNLQYTVEVIRIEDDVVAKHVVLQESVDLESKSDLLRFLNKWNAQPTMGISYKYYTTPAQNAANAAAKFQRDTIGRIYNQEYITY